SDRGWKFVTGTMSGPGQRSYLTTNDELLGVGGFGRPVGKSDEYRLGYLCGAIRGDGHLATHDRARNGRSGRLYEFRLAMIDDPALLRAARYLARFGIETTRFLFQKGTEAKKPIHAIRARQRAQTERILALIQWRPAPPVEWSAGFLAGL